MKRRIYESEVYVCSFPLRPINFHRQHDALSPRITRYYVIVCRASDQTRIEPRINVALCVLPLGAYVSRYLETRDWHGICNERATGARIAMKKERREKKENSSTAPRRTYRAPFFFRALQSEIWALVTPLRRAAAPGHTVATNYWPPRKKSIAMIKARSARFYRWDSLTRFRYGKYFSARIKDEISSGL